MAAADASGSTVLTAPPYPVAVAVLSVTRSSAKAGLATAPAVTLLRGRTTLNGPGTGTARPATHRPCDSSAAAPCRRLAYRNGTASSWITPPHATDAE